MTENEKVSCPKCGLEFQCEAAYADDLTEAERQTESRVFREMTLQTLAEECEGTQAGHERLLGR